MCVCVYVCMVTTQFKMIETYDLREKQNKKALAKWSNLSNIGFKLKRRSENVKSGKPEVS